MKDNGENPLSAPLQEVPSALQEQPRRGRPPKVTKVRPNYAKENAALQARIDVAVDLLEEAIKGQDHGIAQALMQVALKRLRDE